jgi:hypothetical protein
MKGLRGVFRGASSPPIIRQCWVRGKKSARPLFEPWKVAFLGGFWKSSFSGGVHHSNQLVKEWIWPFIQKDCTSWEYIRITFSTSSRVLHSVLSVLASRRQTSSTCPMSCFKTIIDSTQVKTFCFAALVSWSILDLARANASALKIIYWLLI